jgi:hypothetical protein
MGHQFGTGDTFRYVTPVAAQQRWTGPCGPVSVFVTAEGYEIEIQSAGNGFVQVTICNPITEAKLQNERLPLNPANQNHVAQAGDWKII